MSKIIAKWTYSGVDYHDKRDYEFQLDMDANHNSPNVIIPDESINDVIIKDILNCYSMEDGEFPYDIEKIKEVLSDETHTKKYTAPTPNASEYPLQNGTIDYSDTATFYWYLNEDFCLFSIYFEYSFGQANSSIHYYLDPVPKNKGWMVIERFLCPTDGVPNVERIYHDIFDTYEDAKAYFDTFECYDKTKTLHGSYKRIALCDKDDTRNSDWYKNQMKAIALMSEKGETREDDSFEIFTSSHIENLETSKEGKVG